LFVAVDVTVFDSRMIPLTGYTMRRSRVFCLPGKESWTVHAIISAIDAGGARVIAFHEANEDGSKFLDLFSNLTLRSGICFTLESIAFHEFYRMEQVALVQAADSVLSKHIAQNKQPVIAVNGTGRGKRSMASKESVRYPSKTWVAR